MCDCVRDSETNEIAKRVQLKQYQIFVRRLFLSQPFASASLRIDILDEVKMSSGSISTMGILRQHVRLEWRN